MAHNKTQLLLIEIFERFPQGLSQADILQALKIKGHQPDRVTIYRNLLTLQKKGLIHKVFENFYKICEHPCQSHGHIHFICQICKKTVEIVQHDTIETLIQPLKKIGFFNLKQEIILNGTCIQCQKR